MAKRPAQGRTKTRLCPPLSPKQAAALYECFLKDVLEIARTVREIMPDVQPHIAYSPPDALAYFEQLAPDFERICQVGETLGERLDHVLTTTLKNGYTQTAAISSDSPTLPPDMIIQAFRQLEKRNKGCVSDVTDVNDVTDVTDVTDVDVVLGPSEDGGYYLIGMDAPHPRLVREVQMSTPNVLQDTLRLAREASLRVHLLPPWYDVDTAEELNRLELEIAQLPPESVAHTRRFMDGMKT